MKEELELQLVKKDVDSPVAVHVRANPAWTAGLAKMIANQKPVHDIHPTVTICVTGDLYTDRSQVGFCIGGLIHNLVDGHKIVERLGWMIRMILCQVDIHIEGAVLNPFENDLTQENRPAESLGRGSDQAGADHHDRPALVVYLNGRAGVLIIGCGGIAVRVHDPSVAECLVFGCTDDLDDGWVKRHLGSHADQVCRAIHVEFHGSPVPLAHFDVGWLQPEYQGMRGSAKDYKKETGRQKKRNRKFFVAAGVTCWVLEGERNLWTLRMRARDGSLVPLEGEVLRGVPGRLRVTIDYATRMGRYGVAARGLLAEVALTRTPAEKGFVAHFRTRPDWELPFLVEPLLGSRLSYPFEGPGSEAGWAVVEAPPGARFARHYRARMAENWVLRWLGGMTNRAVGEFRAGAEREADRYHGECLLALRDDLVALLDGTTDDGKRKTDNGQRKTDNGQRKTENGQRKTDNGQQKMDNGIIINVRCSRFPPFPLYHQ